MQIPETPGKLEQLDLMRRLWAYADGTATWKEDGSSLGSEAKQACQSLHSHLSELVDKLFAPILDRVTAHEMETFTMHDRTHGLKVAHLMWHILNPSQQQRLTPPEIGLMIAAAHLHDLGMALNPEERAARLDSNSDLWERLELDESVKLKMEELQESIKVPDLPEAQRRHLARQLYQAEEVLLAQDTRARHFLRERYEEVLHLLETMHHNDPVKIPDLQTSLTFDGDSFRDKLIEICISHNEEAEVLVEEDKTHSGRARFPRDYPVGCSVADLQMIAAGLRLADILDFDRERTPPALFYYLLPGPLGEPTHDSGREWGKHLTISNWYLDEEVILFKGRCKSHIIHHAVVLFASAIENEVAATRATFAALRDDAPWPFKLPGTVKVDIHEDGYRYVPYRFEIDDERVYSLLMGGAIYENPLDAVRELVQNAVDACKLRDALTQLNEPYVPNKDDRIFIRYEEPTKECKVPRLIIRDTGTGMDALILERYFLKVGRSFYNSSEFNRTRIDLRKQNLDFAPVSEFGIGFLSVFLLADRVEVETAMWESYRGDTAKRKLTVDGPTRLIKLSEERNEGPRRFKGTQITLCLTQGRTEKNKSVPPRWEEIHKYLVKVCQTLPYRLNLEYVSPEGVTNSFQDPLSLTVSLPHEFEPYAVRIPVNDEEAGLEGEIALFNSIHYEFDKEEIRRRMGIKIADDKTRYHEINDHQDLLRGGFRVGEVPGLPGYSYHRGEKWARLQFKWEFSSNRRYLKTNLARNGVTDHNHISKSVSRYWLSFCLANSDSLPDRLFESIDLSEEDHIDDHTWIERSYNAFEIYERCKRDWMLNTYYGNTVQHLIGTWEAGLGDPLPLPRRGLLFIFLWRILSQICSLAVDIFDSYYVYPPKLNWQNELFNYRNYISAPPCWGSFANYTNDLSDIFYTSHFSFMNARFQEIFTDFNEEELKEIRELLDHLLRYSYIKRGGVLSPSEFRLLRRVKEVAGELQIGDSFESWRLDEFKLPNV